MVYDCIVLGVGGVGSFSLLSAAKRGWKTLGIDRFGVAHDRGSSHGRTRMIRTAYFEHPNYVPLARKAWGAWEELQAGCDVKLIQNTGLLQVGDPGGEVIQGVLKSAKEHDIPVEEYDAAEGMKRFPIFKLAPKSACVFEETAGYLQIENAVTFACKKAIENGAEFRNDTLVDQISVNSDGSVTLRSGDEKLKTERLVVCAGPWSSHFVGDLGIDINVVRKQQHWFQLDRIDIKYENRFPGFLIEDGDGCFYGLPEIDYLGMKVAEHSGGEPVDDPAAVNRDCDMSELQRTERFMDSALHFTRRRLVHHSTCMYSMSSDSHFIVDRHPESARIVFAAGLSGHGFKFAPVLGEHLTNLLDEKEDPVFDFLKMGDRKLGIE